MYFWLVDVKSAVNVNGVDVAFDYINTYFSLSEVHKWILKEDGSQEHADGDDSIPYSFLNKDHREWK